MGNANNAAEIFRRLNREVWVVTACSADQRRGGLLATWVSQASIDDSRPVVVAGLAPNHFTAELVDASGAFGLHLLREDQATVGLDFAMGSGRDRDKLAEYSFAPSTETGAPLLRDCLAWLDCRVYSKLATPDRTYYWASVESAHQVSDGRPLAEQGLIAAATGEQLEQLRSDRLADAARHGPRLDRWRQEIPAYLQP